MNKPNFGSWLADTFGNKEWPEEDFNRMLLAFRAGQEFADEQLEQQLFLCESCLIGWREYDWPEGFDRRTAELMTDNYRKRVDIDE